MGSNVICELKKISERRGGVLIEGQRLGALSTIGIGGKAEVFYSSLSEEGLEESLKYLEKEKKKYFIAGNGSNVLFPDEGFDRAVIRPPENLFSLGADGKTVTVSSGVRVSKLLQECIKWGLSGLECMAGIPASVGGALKNNASSTEGAVADSLERILVLDSSFNKVWLSKNDIRSGYRFFSWPGGGVILRAVFKLKESSSSKVRNKVRELFMEKSRKQPCDKKTLGCVFKNPETGKDVAWKLIDGTGMRGKKEGFAAVSEKHANFIVNEGGATSEDVKKLISEIKSRVLEKFSIKLEEEIEIF